MGWQRNDPSSDFRGAGLIALQNLLYMAQARAPASTAEHGTGPSGTQPRAGHILRSAKRCYADRLSSCC